MAVHLLPLTAMYLFTSPSTVKKLSSEASCQCGMPGYKCRLTFRFMSVSMYGVQIRKQHRCIIVLNLLRRLSKNAENLHSAAEPLRLDALRIINKEENKL